MPRACPVEFHARRYSSRQREPPRDKPVASSREPLLVAANVRLHGARPWHLQVVRFNSQFSKIIKAGLGSCDRYAAGKKVSQLFFRDHYSVLRGGSMASSWTHQTNMITLLHPIWLALAIPLAAAWLLWRHSSRFLRFTRLALLLLILFAL